jgi:two-component system chemotaxis response regulator CheB
MGASAGGVEALRAVVAGLPSDLPAAVLVVLHMPRSSPSALPAILNRVSLLPVRSAVDGEPLRQSRVYVAPVDRHLTVIDHRVRLSRGPAENGHRPAIDPLFRSAAQVFGPRVVGVVLSGSRDDGAAGLEAVARRGGATVVQQPDDALHGSMPRAALEHVAADHVLPAAEIGPLLGQITREPVPEAPVPDDPILAAEVALASLTPLTAEDVSDGPAGYGCPACGGSLFDIPGNPMPRFRCRVGHAWSSESLLDEQAAALESALWMALRALEERVALSQRLADVDGGQGTRRRARYQALTDESRRSAATVRDLIEGMGVGDADARTTVR